MQGKKQGKKGERVKREGAGDPSGSGELCRASAGGSGRRRRRGKAGGLPGVETPGAYLAPRSPETALEYIRGQFKFGVFYS